MGSIDIMKFWLYNFKYRKEMRIIKTISIRLSDKLHKALKFKSFETNVSIQNYFVKLVKQDLNFKDEDDDLSDYGTKQ